MPRSRIANQNRPMPDDAPNLDELFYVMESDIHGKGLFARQPIPQESYLGTYDGQTTRENGMHVLWVQESNGEWIGRDGENLLRYINHTTTPNAEFDGFDLYAIRDIEPDEEITIDYGDEFE